MPSCAMLCHAMLYPATRCLLCLVLSCHALSCHALPCYALPCHQGQGGARLVYNICSTGQHDVLYCSMPEVTVSLSANKPDQSQKVGKINFLGSQGNLRQYLKCMRFCCSKHVTWKIEQHAVTFVTVADICRLCVTGAVDGAFASHCNTQTLPAGCSSMSTLAPAASPAKPSSSRPSL